jgi:predicted RNA-binding protein YlqC (UPF0109 family)
MQPQDDERDTVDADEFELEVEDDAGDIDADDSVATPAAQSSENGAAAELPAPAGDLVRFVEYMASNLVDDPSTLEIRPENFGSAIHIKLIVPEDEMGKVIGRQGRIARSMRTLLTIAAARKGLRASLDIDS